MFRLSRLTIVLLIVAVCAGLFGTAGHIAAVWLVEIQRDRQLNELAELALRRSEAAIDFATAALQDITARTELTCGSASVLQELRFQVYELGAIKDIRITNADGMVRCAAFSETLEFDRDWPQRADMMLSADGSLSLFRVETFSGNALGVLRDANQDQALVAILANGTGLLDVMPRPLRSYSLVGIELTNGQPVYRFNPGDRSFDANQGDGEFVATSSRYPLRSVIRVGAAQFASWDSDLYTPVSILSVLLGLVLGLLLVRTFIRPASPVEEFDAAIANREFVPYLQPVNDLESGAIVSCEILARWVKPDGTVLPPSRFIPLAEASGRIESLTWLLLLQALTELRPLLRRNKDLSVSINVSPHHFLSPGFADDFRKLVSNQMVARRQIVVEITEREPFDDLKAAAAATAALRRDGFKVAIDDVGVGHSGLSHLQILGANILKIDKFFVDSIDLDRTARSIIEMLVRLARQLEIAVVAEGIEDRSQVSSLLSCGVTRGQGFVLSHPLSIPYFVALFNQSRAADDSATSARSSAA